MNTSFPKRILPRSTRPCRALTILEMLVSVALLSFIVLGLTAMFIQTQKAFKTGIKQATITDAGRSVLDMIASDLSQMTDPHFTNVYFPTNVGGPVTLYWATVPGLGLNQIINNGEGIGFRTNRIQDIFLTYETNNIWVGVGYTVSNWFTNGGGGAVPGVGTLYRYVETVPGPLSATNLLFTNFLTNIVTGLFTNTLFHRIADGVINLKLTAFDASGNEMYWEPQYDINGYLPVTSPSQFPPSLQYPVIVQNPTNYLLSQTNYLPHSIDIELGVLEPEAFEHARALFSAGPAAIPAAGLYLTNSAGQVEIFRQHVIIPAAP